MNHTKNFNDGIERDLKLAGIPYEILGTSESNRYTEILGKKYGLSETEKVELINDTSKAFGYGHLESPDWIGHSVLNEVFFGKNVCMRCRRSNSDRLFMFDGEHTNNALNCMGGGRGIIFLKDLSFVIVDHFSYNIIYDGIRNDFYSRAEKLIGDFYKRS